MFNPKRLKKSLGSCNIALTTYVYGPVPFPSVLSSWSNIHFTGLQLLNTCLANRQGGAAIVTGKCCRAEHHRVCRHVDSRLGIVGVPALSLFFWVNGAPFEEVMNGYMSVRFPAGIDPRHPFGRSNGSAGLGNSSSNASYSAYPQNLDRSNSNSNGLVGVAAPVDTS